MRASAPEVWARIVTPTGINDEMRPWLTMSIPRHAEEVTIDNVTVGAPIGRAWLRLFGVIPFDYDHLTITELEPGRRFLEESTMLSMSRWTHERVVKPTATGASVTDRVTLRPRLVLRPLGPLLVRGVRAFFIHRHRRLVRHFGGATR